MDNTNVEVDLRIIGDNFDPKVISEALKISPTDTWNIGDPVRKTGKKRLYTAWVFSTGAEETLDVNTQLIKIEKLFSPKEKKLMEMKKKFALGFCIDIVIVIEKQSPPGIYLGQSIVRFASNIGAAFDIDTYVN